MNKYSRQQTFEALEKPVKHKTPNGKPVLGAESGLGCSHLLLVGRWFFPIPGHRLVTTYQGPAGMATSGG